MIRYLDNASKEIEYTDRDNNFVTVNPFSADYAKVLERLELIRAVEADNARARAAYESAIESGEEKVIVPRCRVAPEDPAVPEFETDLWDPPLSLPPDKRKGKK